jgi:hypothetical protein
VAWTSDIAKFPPKGTIFYCTDYPGGVSIPKSEKGVLAFAALAPDLFAGDASALE